MKRNRQPRPPRPPKPPRVHKRKPKHPWDPRGYPRTNTTERRFYHTVDAQWVGIGSPGSCPSPVKTHIVFSVDVVDSVSLGQSPKDYRAIIAAGGDATSQLRGTRHAAYVHNGFYHYFRTKQSYPLDNQCQSGYAEGAIGGILPFPSAVTVLNSVADQKARQKFLNNALQARKAWRGGNFFVEIAETIQMFKHPLKGLEEGLHAFIRGVKSLRGYWIRGEIEAYARHLGNLWLEYSFGWSPLFEDISDINKALQRLVNGNNGDSVRVIGTGTDRTATKPTPQIVSVGGGLSALAECMQFSKSTQSVRYIGSIVARPEGTSLIQDTFGISYGDILPAVWEGIPWSFLVDYFINVQEQLDSWQFARSDFGFILRGVRNVSANYRTALYPVKSSLDAAHFEFQGGGGAAMSGTTYVERIPQLAPPLPSLQFRIPGLGSLKWVNVGALIAQIQGSSPYRGRQSF